MMDYYTPTHRPMELLEWAEKWQEVRDTTHLVTKVGPVEVSTVWLGLDHSFQDPFSPHHVPIIFETMVFAPKVSGYSDLAMERYSTIEQAVAGHWAMVRHARRWWPVWWLQAWVDRWKYRKARRPTA